MSELKNHPEKRYASEALRTVFSEFCAFASSSDFQNAEKHARSFKCESDEIASTATHELGYPPMFEAELGRVVAWMNDTISKKAYIHADRVKHEYYLKKAFDWAWTKTTGENV
jgi:hypothetical protein